MNLKIFKRTPAKIEPTFGVTLKARGCQDEFLDSSSWVKIFRQCYEAGLLKDDMLTTGKPGSMNLTFSNLTLKQVDILTKIAASDGNVGRFQVSVDKPSLKQPDRLTGQVITVSELVSTLMRDKVYTNINM